VQSDALGARRRSLGRFAAKRDPRENWRLVGQEEEMGLLDVLNGVQDGPGAQRASGSASGGMSPLTMALLGLMRTRPSRVSAAGNQAPARPNLVLHRPRIPARPALKRGHPWRFAQGRPRRRRRWERFVGCPSEPRRSGFR